MSAERKREKAEHQSFRHTHQCQQSCVDATEAEKIWEDKVDELMSAERKREEAEHQLFKHTHQCQ